MKVRKEVTKLEFEGVAMDGGLVFTAYMENWKNMQKKQVPLKLISFSENGVAEIAIDSAVDIATVAQLVSGLFSRYSNFEKCKFLILNYRNVSLKIDRNKGRKVIITMLEKNLRQVKQVVPVTVDTSVYYVPTYGEQFEFKGIQVFGIYSPEKMLQFRNLQNGECMLISAIKDGVITVTFSMKTVQEMIMERKKLFWPSSNFYGIKGIELQIDGFEYIMTKESDVGKVYHLFLRAMAMDCLLSWKILKVK